MSRCSVCNSKGFVEVGAFFVYASCIRRGHLWETTHTSTSALPHLDIITYTCPHHLIPTDIDTNHIHTHPINHFPSTSHHPTHTPSTPVLFNIPPHPTTTPQVPKAEILLRVDVPPKVKANVETFWACVNPECAKLFWEVRKESGGLCVCVDGVLLWIAC